MTPLAVENSVGKLAAPHCEAPNASIGKESAANSHTPFGPCSAARLGGDFMFSQRKTWSVGVVTKKPPNAVGFAKDLGKWLILCFLAVV